MATITDQVRSNMAFVQKVSFGIGVLGLGISGLLLGFNRKEFFESYLISYIYFFAIGSGSLALLMISMLRAVHGDFRFVDYLKLVVERFYCLRCFLCLCFLVWQIFIHGPDLML